jgi:hypothetical protein
VARYTEGFSHFVTSMTAPVASGGSESPARTHWKAPPFTAHTQAGRSPGKSGTAKFDPIWPFGTASRIAGSLAVSRHFCAHCRQTD